jgi:hypothetical protein
VKRIVLAFILAPLWVPLAAIPWSIVIFREYEWTHILLNAGLATAVAYAGTALLALPAFLLLRRFGLTGPGTAMASGFVIAVLLRFALYAAYQWILLDCSLKSVWLGLGRLMDVQQSIAGAILYGPVGVVAGLTFWMIARERPKPGPWSR